MTLVHLDCDVYDSDDDEHWIPLINSRFPVVRLLCLQWAWSSQLNKETARDATFPCDYNPEPIVLTPEQLTTDTHAVTCLECIARADEYTAWREKWESTCQ